MMTTMMTMMTLMMVRQMMEKMEQSRKNNRKIYLTLLYKIPNCRIYLLLILFIFKRAGDNCFGKAEQYQ